MSKPLFKIQTLSVYISTTLVLLLLGVIGTLYIAGGEVSKEMQDNMKVSVIIHHGSDEADILKVNEAINNSK